MRTARLINRKPFLSAHFRVLAKLAVTIAMGLAILARIDLRAVVERMGSIPLGTTLVCILIILGLSYVVAARWHLILASMGTSLALLESWRLVTIGLFFNQTLPSGLGGDAVRVWMMTSRGERLRTSFVSVAVDRIFALGAVVACMVVALPLLNGRPVFFPVLALSLAGVLGFAFLLSCDAALSALCRAWPALATAQIPKILVRGIDLGRDLSRTVLGVSGTPAYRGAAHLAPVSHEPDRAPDSSSISLERRWARRSALSIPSSCSLRPCC